MFHSGAHLLGIPRIYMSRGVLKQDKRVRKSASPVLGNSAGEVFTLKSMISERRSFVPADRNAKW